MSERPKIKANIRGKPIYNARDGVCEVSNNPAPIIWELRHFVELIIDMGARVPGVLEKLAAVLFLVVFLAPIVWPVYALTLGMGWTFLLVWFGLCSWLIFSVVDTENLP